MTGTMPMGCGKSSLRRIYWILVRKHLGGAIFLKLGRNVRDHGADIPSKFHKNRSTGLGVIGSVPFGPTLVPKRNLLIFEVWNCTKFPGGKFPGKISREISFLPV